VFACIISFCCWTSLFAQTDFPTNQKDSSGKKDGFWLIYLTERFIPTKDSSLAFYKAYNLYFHGIDLSYLSACKSDKRKAKLLAINGVKGKKGAPVLLDGNFKLYNRKEKLILDQTFRNGLPLHFEGFTYTLRGKAATHEIINFSEKHDEQLGSYTFKRYWRDNSLLKSIVFFKKDGTWVFEDVK